MKKLTYILILIMVLTSKSFSVERDFEEVAKTNDEIYLLDFASVKAAGSNGEIKYIVLISFAKPQKFSNGDKYLSTQLYMKGLCLKDKYKPYLLQYYDVKMDDGDTMKGNIVRTAEWDGEWISPKEQTGYYYTLKFACDVWGKKMGEKIKNFSLPKN